MRSMMTLWAALEVASHQSRLDAVWASRAIVNFKWFWMRVLRPETDLSRADTKASGSDIRLVFQPKERSAQGKSIKKTIGEKNSTGWPWFTADLDDEDSLPLGYFFRGYFWWAGFFCGGSFGWEHGDSAFADQGSQRV